VAPRVYFGVPQRLSFARPVAARLFLLDCVPERTFASNDLDRWRSRRFRPGQIRLREEMVFAAAARCEDMSALGFDACRGGAEANAKG
jgi:hypothetical protein